MILRRGVTIVLLPVVMRVIVGGWRCRILRANRHRNCDECMQRQSRDQQREHEFIQRSGHDRRF